MLSETELVEAFIEASIHGQETLLANKQFLAESRFGTNHLMHKQTGLLAKVNVKQDPTEFWVRHDAPNYEWFQDLLQQHQFLSTGQHTDDGLSSYQHVPSKDGYTLNCQPARALWKNWRTLYRMYENMDKAQKLLIREGHDWEQIRSMTVSSNVLFIETPAGETSCSMDDAIAWLSETETAGPTQEDESAQATPPAQETQPVGDPGGFSADGFIA
ncbi:hypothetical protein PN498_16190 [Oscillatoria sp. CS-180]|uniref:hypothetical protein n=1 Tax=Oscillatoria sp. CS-180 TaxID=3021720 RepID=UPI00232CEDB7|nr:hypothetical protein [Oscillatoria sp. CS-180]MDB9527539.1 hypothetical protein [Oscillatoria sp. CS-180]